MIGIGNFGYVLSGGGKPRVTLLDFPLAKGIIELTAQINTNSPPITIPKDTILKVRDSFGDIYTLINVFFGKYGTNANQISDTQIVLDAFNENFIIERVSHTGPDGIWNKRTILFKNIFPVNYNILQDIESPTIPIGYKNTLKSETNQVVTIVAGLNVNLITKTDSLLNGPGEEKIIQKIDANKWILTGGAPVPEGDIFYGVDGAINGVNKIFTVTKPFMTNKSKVYLNGVRQFLGLGADYTELGNATIEFTSAPVTNDRIIVEV